MPPLRPDAVLSGRYRLVERVGAGGNGTVWRAHDDVLGRDVAVKCLHEALELDEDVRARFRREATSAAAIHHPHAAVVYDIGEDGDRPYLVMELVEGPSLADLMDGRPLDAGVVAAIGHQIAGALGVAHERGLAHRDVKPGNVLLTLDGAAKVVDFGIAKALGDATQQLTMSGTVVGTAAYLAPEQLEPDATVDGRADVYALGLLLHELLTGRSPFVGTTAAEVAAQRLVADVPTPLERHPGVPDRLDAIIAAATRRDPEERFPDGTALAAALAPLVPERPLQVVAEYANRTPSPAHRTRALPVEDEPEAARTQLIAAERTPDQTLLIPTSAASETVAIPRSDGPATDPTPRVSAAARSAAAPAPAATPAAPARGHDAPDGSSRGDDRSPRPRRTGLWAGIAVVGLALVAAATLSGQDTGGDPGASPSDEVEAGGPGSPYRIAGGTDVDPHGGDGEHPEDVPRAFDGNPDTVWNTQIYSSADFGGLKPGVGIAFDLGESVPVAQVQLLLATPGLDLQIHASDQPFAGADLGEPVGSVSDAPAEPTIDVGGTTGRYWLVWLTSVPGGRGEIAEVEFDRPT